MSVFDTLSASFLQSFKAQPTATFHKDLEIRDLRSQNSGRGIIATTAIPADTELFTIPRSFVISVENSELSTLLPQLFNDDGDEMVVDDHNDDTATDLPKPWLDLILVLIYESLHVTTSKWRDYWFVLPHEFDTLMFWSEPELQELQASAARKKIGRDDADAMFKRKIVPVVQRHADVFYPAGTERLGEEELLQLAHRMGSLIMAYAFDLESEREDEDEEGEDGWTEDREGKMAMGMVPMADMLNADAEFNAHLEHGDTSLTMRSLRSIAAGEQVLNYYGPLPNSDLLRRYGYTSEKHARYDVVEIEWDLVAQGIQDVLGSIPEGVIDAEDLEESFVLERESGDPDETGRNPIQAKFTAFPETLVDQVTEFTKATLKIKGSSTDEHKRLKQKFLQIMKKTLAARLAQYATTFEQDQELLRQSGFVGRRKMAIDVRMGEKKLLKEAQQLVDQLLVKYTDTETNGKSYDPMSEPPSKRHKFKR